MNPLFSPLSLDEFIRLLRAWRLWVLGALVGALLGGSLYLLLPPPYEARATVNIDFNLEEAWPQETDRQQFYYLERESRKLEEIAWSDDVLRMTAGGDDIASLRAGRLRLAQPAEAGWHFYARDPDPRRAGLLASTWAQAFATAARKNLQGQEGLNSFIRLEVTQAAGLPIGRSVSVGIYLLTGVLVAWFLGAFGLLFMGYGKLRCRGERV